MSCSQKSELNSVAYPSNSDPSSKLATIPRGINYNNIKVTPEQFIELEKVLFKTGLFIPVQPVGEVRKEVIISWREIEPKVEDFLAEHATDKFASYYRQKCALELLCMTDILADPSESTLPVIGKYLDILSNENNSSVAVFYPALNRLKSYWPEAKTKRVSKLVIEQAEFAVNESKKFRAKFKSDKNNNQVAQESFVRGEQFNKQYIGLIKDKIL